MRYQGGKSRISKPIAKTMNSLLDRGEKHLSVFSVLKSELGKFKVNSPLNRKWVELCKENNLSKVIYKPYLPLCVNAFEGKCSSRLFKINDTIYCSFSTDEDFKAPSGLKEIKGSTFYKAIEDDEQRKNKI